MPRERWYHRRHLAFCRKPFTPRGGYADMSERASNLHSPFFWRSIFKSSDIGLATAGNKFYCKAACGVSPKNPSQAALAAGDARQGFLASRLLGARHVV